MIVLKDVFNKLSKTDEYSKFSRIENPLHPTKADIAAFLLLDKLIPDKSGIIGGATHELIWLSTDIDKLAEVATEEDILYLYRCGVRLGEYDSLEMYT